jgi:DNA repair photolyase
MNTTTTNKTSTSNERLTMNEKPVLYRDNIRTVLTDPSPAFAEKLLCDGLTLNLGDACAFDCTFCYVPEQMRKIDKVILDAYNAQQRLINPDHVDLGFQDVVIRRRLALSVLAGQLIRKDGSSRYPDPDDHRVLYSSTLVDVAANMDLLRETAAACNLILENTGWHIRLLSKSSLLPKFVERIPEKYHHRLIFGFSTGTLDERVCQAIELGTARVSKRIEALHWLQDRGFRTFGMICPSLPQEDYAEFSRTVCEAIRVDRCEHVWAEVINLRGESLAKTYNALCAAGLHSEAERLDHVQGSKAKTSWEDYARRTFLAHTENVPPEKLRFLQYVTPASADWWSPMRSHGAVLLGGEAERRGLTTAR